MKAKLLLSLLFFSLIINAQNNLVSNGDFENWTSSSQPDNWFRYFSGFASQSTSAQNGTSSINMMIADGTFNYINSEFFPVVANKTYRITLYHKLVSGSFSAIDLSLYHQPGTFKEEIIKKTDATFSNSEWRKIEFEYTPTVSENIEVDIWTTGTLNSEILVDNVSVIDVATIGAQYTLIPDVNFENKLIALGIDSGVSDGKVLTNNVNILTSLDVSNSSIVDLTGIQDFVALKTLYCLNNKLTSLDVSKNVALNNLYPGNNQLTTLDVSKNVELVNLQCWDNQITSLDVSKNITLTSLGCSKNKLTTLDVSKNVELVNLQCWNNQITSLDVSKNITLTSLGCSKNKLTTLDISKNVALTIFRCSNNELTSLNLKNGKNSLITDGNIELLYNPNLKCVLVDDVAYSNANWANIKDATASYSTDCTPYTLIPDANFEGKLIALEIDKDGKNGKVATASINQITFLDVADSNISDLTGLQDFAALIYFFCDRNKITNVDFSKNLMLENIGVLDNNLTSLDVSKNTKIHTLEFSKNQITSVDLSQNTNLKRLGFENNKLTEINLTNNKELWFVSGYGNQLSSLDLSQNKKIEVVNVDNNQLTAINVQNGNNKNFALPPATSKTTTNIYCSFANNNKLECIKVDDEAYSNANWANIKDVTATYSSTCSKLGIEDSVFDKVAIYPNPAQGELHIDNIILEKATVYDALGKLVKTNTFTSGSNDNTMHLEGFRSGIYYIYLESEGANTAKKIIVK